MNSLSARNGKEWIRTALAHRQPPRVPFNFIFSPPARRKAEEFFRVHPIEQGLNFPIRMNGPKSVKPLYADPAIYGETVRDEFGVVWSTSSLDRGAPLGPCLPEPDLTGYTFPDPADPARFEELADWCRAEREGYIILWVGDLWERVTFMRGMENALLDLALHPQFISRLLESLAESIRRTIEILARSCEFDGIAISDDYGAQQGMVMSPETWRRLVKPHLARIYALARQRGKTVLHHSCGNIRPIIGDLADIGLDILHPIQPEAMDGALLKREFGRTLTLCGGLRTQDLLPAGTPAQIRKEVRRLKETLGAGGGYILEPGITIQSDVPQANIAALIEEARA